MRECIAAVAVMFLLLWGGAFYAAESSQRARKLPPEARRIGPLPTVDVYRFLPASRFKGGTLVREGRAQ